MLHGLIQTLPLWNADGFGGSGVGSLPKLWMVECVEEGLGTPLDLYFPVLAQQGPVQTSVVAFEKMD